MKKLIFIAIFSVLLASPLAPVRAQVATTSDPMTVEQIQVLLNQLTAIVLDLMQQLADLRAETPADAPTLGATEAPVDEPVALPELVASVEFDVPNFVSTNNRVDAGGNTDGSQPITYTVAGNWDKAILKIVNTDRNFQAANGPVTKGTRGDYSVWQVGESYTWTLTYSRGEETKTLIGSFTTPSK